MNQPSVLIISDRGDFPESILRRWQIERSIPSFTVMNSEVFLSGTPTPCNLILAGGLERSRMAQLSSALSESANAIVVVENGMEAAAFAHRGPRVSLLCLEEGWVEPLVLLAAECLRRQEAVQRAERAEEAAVDAASHATLGRYMLDMRHGLNNALTSVLGNAELLLLEPAAFPEHVCEQLATIRSMSLRINEIVSRFSSLETELLFAKRESRGEPAPFVRSTAVGYTSF